MSLGTLHVTIKEAHLTHDVKKLGKMDPYVRIVCRDFNWKSAADRNGSKKPVWEHDNSFDIDVKYLGDDIYFKVLDEDKGKDEKVGDGCAKISTFCAQEHSDLWLDIEYKGKDAGKVRFVTHWKPSHTGPSKDEHQGLLEEA
jgi:Ca2+-dependent lipid-binding protein